MINSLCSRKWKYFLGLNSFDGIISIMENIIIFCLGFIHICNYIVTSPTYFVHPDLALEWTRRWSKKSRPNKYF